MMHAEEASNVTYALANGARKTYFTSQVNATTTPRTKENPAYHSTRRTPNLKAAVAAVEEEDAIKVEVDAAEAEAEAEGAETETPKPM